MENSKMHIRVLITAIGFMLMISPLTTYAEDHAEGIYGSDRFSEALVSETIRPDALMDDTLNEDENLSAESTYILDSDLVTIDENQTFPAKYDPRSIGKVSSGKSQGSYGSCWAFAAIALMEQSLIYNGITDTSIDLSEAKLIYENKGSKTFKDALNMSSYSYYYLNHKPVVESKAKYSDIIKGQENSYVISDSVLNDYDYVPTNIYSAKYSNKNEVKSLITKFGGVSLDFYADLNYNLINSNERVFYNNNKTSMNHAVIAIGWDDNFSADNFKTTAPGNGAWLIKNSDIGNKSSYCWISYYDTSIDSTGYTVDMREKNYLPTGICVNQTEFNTKLHNPVYLTAYRVANNTGNFYVGINDSDIIVEKISDTNYKITPNKAGIFYITVKLYTTDYRGCENIISSQDIKLNVAKPKIYDITINNVNPDNNARYNIINNKTYQLNVDVDDEIADDLIYESDKPSVATVDNTGKITTKDYGYTTIRVKNTKYDTSDYIYCLVCSEGFTVNYEANVTGCDFSYGTISIPFTAISKEGIDITNKVINTDNIGYICNNEYICNYSESSIVNNEINTTFKWNDYNTTHEYPIKMKFNKVNHDIIEDTIKGLNGSNFTKYIYCKNCNNQIGYYEISDVSCSLIGNNLKVSGEQKKYDSRGFLMETIPFELVENVDYTVDTSTEYYSIVFTDQCKYYTGAFQTDISSATGNMTTPGDPNGSGNPANGETNKDQSGNGQSGNQKKNTQSGNKRSDQSVSVTLSKPSKPKLKTGGKGKLKVSWQKSKNAKKYEVWISTSKNFKSVKKKKVSKTSVIFKKLTPGKKYYVKVRAINGSRKSGWSKKAGKVISK